MQRCDEVLRKALEILRAHPLCDRCLGRLFASLGGGLTNEERGRAIKTLLLMSAPRGQEDAELLRILARSGFRPALDHARRVGLEVEEAPCYICEGALRRLHALALKAVSLLKAYDARTFVVGSMIPGHVLSREEELASKYGLEHAESIKREVNREVSKVIQRLLGLKPEFENPDILVLVDPFSASVRIEPRPLYIYGRYRKLRRDIPQNRWCCSSCWGSGCAECGWSGKRYPLSIEELIACIVLRATGGDSAKLHGAGREDVDARMLGEGRPFIIEIKNPRRRHIDLAELEREINYRLRGYLEVYGLRLAAPGEIERMKALAEVHRKVYRALVVVSEPTNEGELRRLEEQLRGRVISQRTPRRVLHRRVDKIRHKKVYEVRTRLLEDRLFEAIISAQGGLYIKELVSGDAGRTSPSFAEILGKPARCVKLDVLEVEG